MRKGDKNFEDKFDNGWYRPTGYYQSNNLQVYTKAMELITKENVIIHSGELKKELHKNLSTDEFEDIFEEFYIWQVEFGQTEDEDTLQPAIVWEFTIFSDNDKAVELYVKHLQGLFSPDFEPKFEYLDNNLYKVYTLTSINH